MLMEESDTETEATMASQGSHKKDQLGAVDEDDSSEADLQETHDGGEEDYVEQGS